MTSFNTFNKRGHKMFRNRSPILFIVLLILVSVFTAACGTVEDEPQALTTEQSGTGGEVAQAEQLLLDLVLEDPSANTRETLLDHARQLSSAASK